ncbi:hypothetical protein O6H91_13G020000 [Diphasiastrum complanatum]|uniref:Uncharacterized protein n=1 Tax=Diphasiastrum complanatum TaxID=34168 RepID=A0ACC2BSN8_DIPCM|nr:hypothetical protein O6H91_13G020000 [Diphasiastrum complanatum]
MNGSVPQRRAGRGGRHQSLFYRDLSASPTTRSLAVKGESGTPIQGTVAVALWRENVGGADPPPPPFYTLEDRIERSPETPLGESTYRSPDFKYLEGKSPAKTPISSPSSRGGFGVGIVDGVSGYHSQSPVLTSPLQYRTSGSPALWSPSKEYNLFDTRDKRDGESPVSGVVHQQQSGGLLTLPTPREIVRFELQESGGIVASGEEGEEWVTVFGFRVEETNSVVREFEKCGPIVRHVPGPGGANWVHIQFQVPLPQTNTQQSSHNNQRGDRKFIPGCVNLISVIAGAMYTLTCEPVYKPLPLGAVISLHFWPPKTVLD